MTFYNSSALIGGKFIHKKPLYLQGLLSSVNDVISTNERIEFITSHMTYTVSRSTTHSKKFAGNQRKH